MNITGNTIFIPGSVLVDTTDAGSIESAASQVLDRHPDLNVLVPMAGIMRVEDWRKPDQVVTALNNTDPHGR